MEHVKVAWKIEGANWSEIIVDNIDSQPIEIATKAIEQTYKFKKIFRTPINDYVLGLGIILMISHDQMKSADEIFICHTPTALANAGLHNESVHLQNLIDRLLKSFHI